MMKYLSGKTGCYDSYEFAKNILGKVGELKEFTAFYSEKTPYYQDFGIDKAYYNFIIKDEEGNEVWFDTNCGYGGTGPSCTEKILQLFGARDEYGIDKEKIIHKINVKLNHDINILVLSQNRYKTIDKNKEIMFIKIKPNSAKCRYNLIKGLENIGTFEQYNKKHKDYEEYFEETFKDKSLGDYRTNNLFYISRYLKEFSREELEKIFRTIIVKNAGEAVEIDIKTIQKV